MQVQLTHSEQAINQARVAQGWEPYIKVQCACGTQSPFRTMDELRVGYWDIRKTRHLCPACLTARMRALRSKVMA